MKKWIKAARLRTLPLSVSGIILGAAYAFQFVSDKSHFWIIFILCLLTTLFFQVLSNYANDYGDAVKGTDNENRVGPKRAIQSGEISKKAMKKAIFITALLGLLASVAIIYLSFGSSQFIQAAIYFILAIASISAAIKYTVGNSAYGYRGLGDVFVFVFFGLVSTLGVFYLYVHAIDYLIILPAVGIGLLSTAVLNMNNMRDIDNDTAMQKNTLVVKIGYNNAKKYHYFLVLTALISFTLFALLTFTKWYQFVFLIACIPLIKNVKKVSKTITPKLLDPELKRIALTTFLITLLLSIAILIN
ncbi:1,4-dihydroxy-2-naphthoate octaprenyltransferase [Myroides sp. JBRI-B21084]|uniref:1,4-dihydroxy-2-naphthoate octaprenyltransferase n=1 Tax=Myroides sp. JBRI-B21084 TaxID=3119977 RepID=UPI0026E37A3A|nr:1,4-dihydroxy-2-naphthoate octaprenyltransferase [Paenimyroides cloacae]WKW45583.1 1,4-dihydroxy-2-naphthoate octaprenyltransferase [Paenimyroides cloacae]